VDRVVKHGFGLRLALMGPLERADIGGLDVTLAVQEYLLPHLDNRVEASPLLAQKVREGRLGVKTGRGFYSWSGEDRTRLLARRERLLLQIIALLNEEA
jgi:3-hydroxybutyryl-CoA dehydrogenase